MKIRVLCPEINGWGGGNLTSIFYCIFVVVFLLFFFVCFFFFFKSNAHLWRSLIMLYWPKFCISKEQDFFFMFDHQFLVCKYCLEKVYARGVGDLERVARVSVNTPFCGKSLQSKQFLFF